MSNEKSTITEKDDFSLRLKEAFRTNEVAEIARKLAVTYQGAKNCIEGRIPAPEVLIAISNSTGCSIHWLLTGEGEKFIINTEQMASESVTGKVKNNSSAPSPFLIKPYHPSTINRVGQLTATTLHLLPPRTVKVMLNESLLRGVPLSEVVCLIVIDDSLKHEGCERNRQLICLPGATVQPCERASDANGSPRAPKRKLLLHNSH